MNRRTAITSILKIAFFSLFYNYRELAFAQANYVQKIIPLPYPVYTCEQLDKLIQEKRNSLRYLQDNRGTIIGQIRKQYEQESSRLQTYRQNLNNAYNSKKVETTLACISTLVGLALTAVLAIPTVAASSGAVATVFAIQIIGGTAFMCYQAVKLKQSNEMVMLNYTKDRVSVFTTILTHNTQSSVGRVFSRIVSVLGLSLDLYSIIQNASDLVSQKSKIDKIISEVVSIDAALKNLGSVQWYQLELFSIQNSIDGLQKILDQARSNNCVIGSTLLLFPPNQVQPSVSLPIN